MTNQKDAIVINVARENQSPEGGFDVLGLAGLGYVPEIHRSNYSSVSLVLDDRPN